MRYWKTIRGKIRSEKKDINLPSEASEWDYETVRLALQYSMTSPQRLWALISSVKYIIRNRIDGAFCECGVWRGGSVLAIARTLESLDVSDRKIYMFDTFEGMTTPTEIDKRVSDGMLASNLLESTKIEDGNNVWAFATESDVARTLELTTYSKNNFIFIKGDVVKTLPRFSVDKISLLRLDTDWYESTMAEYIYLYPKIVEKGICIIDDYGYWEGSKRATDEFLASLHHHPYLHYVDYSGRLFIKI